MSTNEISTQRPTRWTKVRVHHLPSRKTSHKVAVLDLAKLARRPVAAPTRSTADAIVNAETARMLMLMARLESNAPKRRRPARAATLPGTPPPVQR